MKLLGRESERREKGRQRKRQIVRERERREARAVTLEIIDGGSLWRRSSYGGRSLKRFEIYEEEEEGGGIP